MTGPLPPNFISIGEAAVRVLADIPRGQRMDLELIELNVDLITRTDRAVHVRDHGTGRLVWLPIALIEITRADDGESWVVDVPEWLAVERELV